MPVIADGIPPHNLEAEQAVIGAILLDNDAVSDVVNIIGRSNEMFYSATHQAIYSAMLAIIDKGRPVDGITLAEQLREDGKYELGGGVTYIGEIVDAVPTAANVAYYAEIVRHCHIRREVHRVCTRLAAESLEADSSCDSDWLDKAHSGLLALFEHRDRHYPLPAIEIVSGALAEIQAVVDGKPRNEGWTTGYTSLDAVHGGFVPNLYIYASRPSVGKTTLAANIACHVAAGGHPTLFFALEMSDAQMMRKILMFRAGVNWGQVRAGFNARSQLDKVRFIAPGIGRWPLWIDDTPNLTPNALRAKVRKHIHQHGPTLVIIDYLQLMDIPQARGQNRYEALGGVSRTLKNLSGELECPFIGISQLGRDADGVDPKISHLRESGNFEQDADVIILLSRYLKPEITELHKAGRYLNVDFDRIVKVHIAKNREGETGVVQMIFDKSVQQFREPGQPEIECDAETGASIAPDPQANPETDEIPF